MERRIIIKKLATFAGGCFWCMVKPFDEYEGVESVISGYTGGYTQSPTYEDVYTDLTGHIEAIQITFDDEIISYKELLDIYWSIIDPTQVGGLRFCINSASLRFIPKEKIIEEGYEEYLKYL